MLFKYAEITKQFLLAESPKKGGSGSRETKQNVSQCLLYSPQFKNAKSSAKQLLVDIKKNPEAECMNTWLFKVISGT